MVKVVLQKFLATAGVASRRQAEALIKGGNVKINGRMAKLGDRVEETDSIKVRNKLVSHTSKLVYIKLNKPLDYVCTNRSFPGEKNVFDLVKFRSPLTIVGRLDKDSEGLVLLTNDGELAYRFTHPKFGVEKVYMATVGKDLGKEKKEEKATIAKITEKALQGVDIGLGDGIAKVERIKHLRGRTFEVVLRQGKKRQIRRIFRQLGFPLSRLTRHRIGAITIGRLRKGAWEFLSRQEVEKILAPESVRPSSLQKAKPRHGFSKNRKAEGNARFRKDTSPFTASGQRKAQTFKKRTRG